MSWGICLWVCLWLACQPNKMSWCIKRLIHRFLDGVRRTVYFYVSLATNMAQNVFKTAQLNGFGWKYNKGELQTVPFNQKSLKPIDRLSASGQSFLFAHKTQKQSNRCTRETVRFVLSLKQGCCGATDNSKRLAPLETRQRTIGLVWLLVLMNQVGRNFCCGRFDQHLKMFFRRRRIFLEDVGLYVE